LFDIQFTPELVENQIRFSSAANNLTPSAEDATEVNLKTGALFVAQLAPEFVDVRIRCVPDTIAAATNFVPSAEQATALQVTEGTLLETQLVPELVVV
jgi:hypothetical protein